MAIENTNKSKSETEHSSVAVIGFGPGGIAAARALLRADIKPLVLEASPDLGGLWNKDDRKMWQSVHTNLSRFTCSFADMPWSSSSPLFPSANEVYEYLKAYVDKYIPIDCVQFHSQVTQISREEGTKGYKVKWINTTTREEFCEIFEHVVIAGGFFAQPHIHPSLIEALSSFEGVVKHSSQYYNANSFKDKVVAVVGGSFSGCELAVEIAQNARLVHHISPGEVFIVPRFLPEQITCPKSAFLPLDMVFYNLSHQRLEEMQSFPCEKVHKTDYENAQTWAYFQQMTSQHLDSKAPEEGRRTRIAICDHYFTLVHSGAIRRISGYLRSASAPRTLVVESDTAQSELHDVDEVVLCTGYKPHLSFLDEAILEVLRFQRDDDFLPCDLIHDIYSPHLPGLYFVGSYRGPYFGGLQAQAEVVARNIAGTPSPAAASAEFHDQFAKLRKLPPAHRPQFPHSDSVGHILDLWRLAHGTQFWPANWPQKGNVEHNHNHNHDDNEVIFIPAVLSGDLDTIREMKICNAELRTGRHVASSLFQALAYTHIFSMRREITDHLSNALSVVDGQVSFRSIGHNPHRLLYQEEGKLLLRDRLVDVSQTYIYENNKEKDSIDIFFSKVDDKESIDRPFLSLQFFDLPLSSSELCSASSCGAVDVDLLARRRQELSSVPLPSQPDGWVSIADHLCGQDYYRASYAFCLAGLRLRQLSIVFDVLGPHKNYRSRTDLFATAVTNSLDTS